jgi:Ca2+-binding RTX toxin-like protein
LAYFAVNYNTLNYTGTSEDDRFAFSSEYDANYFNNLTNIDGGAGIDTAEFSFRSNQKPLEEVVFDLGKETFSLTRSEDSSTTTGTLKDIENLDINFYGADGGSVKIKGSEADNIITATAENVLRSKEVDFEIYGYGGDDRLSSKALSSALYGGEGNDYLNAQSSSGLDKLFGGVGDDTYDLSRSGDVSKVELTDIAGVDTVITQASYVLKDGFENLTLTGTEDESGTGNDGDNIIKGNYGDNTLTGKNGQDTFVIDLANKAVETWEEGYGRSMGHDIITDFDIEKDSLDFSSLSEGELNARKLKFASNDDLVIEMGDGMSLTLKDDPNSSNYLPNYKGYGFEGRTLKVDELSLLPSFKGPIFSPSYQWMRGGEAIKDATKTSYTLTEGDVGLDIQIQVILTDDYGNTKAFEKSFDDIEKGVTLSKGETFVFSDKLNQLNLILTGKEEIDGTGNSAANEITGNNVENKLYGLDGDDTLTGKKGDDTLSGGEGKDKLFGGKGQDTLFGDAGKDKLKGKAGSDVLEGGEDDDKLKGNKGKDTLNGDEGNDTLEGGKGQDTLYGSQGDDELSGNKGKDFLVGGKGNDKLTGGKGADTFVFTKNSQYIKDKDGKYILTPDSIKTEIAESDTITDFSIDQKDKISLIGFGFDENTKHDFEQDGKDVNFVLDEKMDISITFKNMTVSDLTGETFMYE